MAKVLVVDDDFMNRKMAGIILKKLRHEFEIAENGMQALQMMESEKYDIVLLDLLMPGMSGRDVLIERENRGLAKDAGIIVLSGAEDEDIVERVLNMGADDFIKKPMKAEVLKEKIDSIIKLS